MSAGRPGGSISLDLDDKWSYLRTHGDPSWSDTPSFLHRVVPRMLDLLDEFDLRATFFVVGSDAELPRTRDLIRTIHGSGHEVGNHSYRHEPWLARYSAAETYDELSRAHDAVGAAVDDAPVGFRGPGYSLSASTLSVLERLGYHYDASLLPTWIGPLARAWYLRSTHLDECERRQREALFGRFRDGGQPLRPFRWDLDDARLVEVPVTTMPLTRLPIHATYLLYLWQRSPALARRYLRTAVSLCRWRRVGPSMLLHPIEFLDHRDPEARDLAFLPGVDRPYGSKHELLAETLEALRRSFVLTPLAEHAAQLATDGLRDRRSSLVVAP